MTVQSTGSDPAADTWPEGSRLTERDAATTWDLLVVGGGTAGLVGAQTAALLGARVLLVERDRTGGECLWSGCVPSKALLAAASAAADARRASRLGVHAEVSVDFPAVMAHVRRAIADIAPVDAPQALEAAGVRAVRGTVVLTGATTAAVDGREVRFARALLATGSRPAPLPLPGVDRVAPLTADDVWDLEELPSRLVVLGGGTTGTELAQALARLGAQVTVVEAGEHLLPREDADAAAVVTAALRADGVDVRTGVRAASVRPGSSGAGVLVLEDGDELAFARLLLAGPRRPVLDGLGLAAAGVEVDADGRLVLEPGLRTTSPSVWAAGDVTGEDLYTHTAGVRGSDAAVTAVLGLPRRPSPVVPRVTFTDTELAAVGEPTTGDAPGRRVLHLAHDHVDRAVADGRTEGFTRLVVDRRGRVRGATVVGPRAGEVLAELTAAVLDGTTTSALVARTHPYPTYGDGPWNAAIADYRARLGSPVVRALTRTVVTARRWRRARSA
ncbi:NAD(P)/FAD-dependent oxidoreductase [uncultured Pseudokineococcus sp.]|uniref:dihydrolipoyl dehydrogenase family protein n=1 Tax=uncultured Pseudokineococcus sp. TaxID=1642928 RepID=UPI0026215400|nr:FAD-dependent oxidoreductase [uncultured Pseudokineococcus sp.]